MTTTQHDTAQPVDYAANVRAFIVATVETAGLGDATYRQLVTQGTPMSLLMSLYPYDFAKIANLWYENRRPWFRRRNFWDRLLHARAMNQWARAVLALQAYMPSPYLADMVKNPIGNALFERLVVVHEHMSAMFVTGKYRLLNPQTGDYLMDMFNDAAFISRGGDIRDIIERQVNLKAKTSTNAGFEQALANFFRYTNKLIDLPGMRRA